MVSEIRLAYICFIKYHIAWHARHAWHAGHAWHARHTSMPSSEAYQTVQICFIMLAGKIELMFKLKSHGI